MQGNVLPKEFQEEKDEQTRRIHLKGEPNEIVTPAFH
jgi:hypothetical protein